VGAPFSPPPAPPDPRAPAEAREMLERALADYDAGLARADHTRDPSPP
jgi:hypothetical protein